MGKLSKKSHVGDNKQSKISSFFQNRPAAPSGGASSKLFSHVESKSKLSLEKKPSSSLITANPICQTPANQSNPHQVHNVNITGQKSESSTSHSSHSEVITGSQDEPCSQQLHDSKPEPHDQDNDDIIPDTPKPERTHNATFLDTTVKPVPEDNEPLTISTISPDTPDQHDDSLVIPDTPEEVNHNQSVIKKKLYKSSRSFLFSASDLCSKSNKGSKARKHAGNPAVVNRPSRSIEDALTDDKVPSREEKAEGQVAMAAIMSDMGLGIQQRVQLGLDVGTSRSGSSHSATSKTGRAEASKSDFGPAGGCMEGVVDKSISHGAESDSSVRKRTRSKGESPDPKRLASRTTPKKMLAKSSRGAEMVHNAQVVIQSGRIWRNPDNVTDRVTEVMSDDEPEDIKENVKWGIKKKFTKDSVKAVINSKKVTPVHSKTRKNIFSCRKVCDKNEDTLNDILSELRTTPGIGNKESRSPHVPSDNVHGKKVADSSKPDCKSEDASAASVAMATEATGTSGTYDNAALLEGEDEALDDIMNELKTKILSPVSCKTRSARPVINPYTPLTGKWPNKPKRCSPLTSSVNSGVNITINTPTLSKSSKQLISTVKLNNSEMKNLEKSHVVEQQLTSPDIEMLEEDKKLIKAFDDDKFDCNTDDKTTTAVKKAVAMDTDLEEVAKGLSQLSPFKQPMSESCDTDMWNPPAAEFGRHKVISIAHEKYNVILDVEGTFDKKIKSVILQGFWSDVHVKVGDIVNILGEFDSDGVCHVTDKQHLIVIHPDLLISGTSVVNCVHCMRKSVLNEKFKGCDSGNIYMLYGSIIHAIFQEVLKTRAFSRPAIESVINVMLKQSWCLQEMYGQNVTEPTVREEIEKYIPQIVKFVEKYVATHHHQLGQKLNPDSDMTITKVADIEENIWSPRYGIKGRIDITVEVKIHGNGSSNKSKKWEKKKILPLELKTGKASFSMEHKGQVTLYSMMFGDRRADPESGLLLYLKEGKMETIPASYVNKRGLIQLRNELAYYLSTTTEKFEDPTVKDGWKFGSLPRPISREMMCSKCPQLLNCAAYQRTTEDWSLPSDHIMHTLVPETLSHLKPTHLAYFSHWCKLLHLEMSQGRGTGGVKDLWCKTGDDREQNGECVCNLELVTKSASPTGSREPQVFRRRKNHQSKLPVSDVGLNRNDSVVVSAENKPFIAIATGTITDIDAESVTLTLDRELGSYPEYSDLIYRVDKLDYLNTLGINFTNLSRLLNNTAHCAKLRELVIERKRPDFDLTLSKGSIEKVKEAFKSMNKPQKTAILKVLMSQDYVLIKGYPGTGKTSTIVSLVRILTALNQTVLLASYTHSAVDNILLKLKRYKVDFLRLGRAQRVHKDILPYSAEVLANGINSVDDLRELYHSKVVVATTCLGTNHPLFSQRQFDVCIVDEASQVLQPACFGPLMCSRKFVLVGDPLQLAPVVQSHEARKQGLDESLFARLDDTGGTYELNLQYRMNSEIMRLSNELVYGGALKCGNNAVSSATLQIKSTEPLKQCVSWLQDALDPAHEVIWLNTQSQCEQMAAMDVGAKSDSNVKSELEAQIVCKLVTMVAECGLVQDKVGVITPYRQQVWLLRQQCRLNNMADVEVNTIDQYQGRDKDLIIMSFVKSQIIQSDNRGGGILQDLRRLNVAITRAKHKLILIGCIPALLPYQPVAALIDSIKSQNIILLPE